MTAQAASMSFFPVLLRVCSDPDGFAPLLRRPLSRALAHYLLLAILAILGSIALRSIPLRARLSRATATFEARFGEVVVADASLRPAIAPETARGASLGALRVDYFPDNAAAAGFRPASLSAPAGLLWTPTALLLWQRHDERRCSVLPFPVGLFLPELASRPWLPMIVEADAVAGQLDQGALLPAPGRSGATVRRRPADLLPLLWGMLLAMAGI